MKVITPVLDVDEERFGRPIIASSPDFAKTVCPTYATRTLGFSIGRDGNSKLAVEFLAHLRM